jgi:branched-chain amino acid transport system substrate-binding protein
MKRKRLFTLIGGICFVLGLGLIPFIPHAAAPPAEPYKIGFLTCATGFMAVWGSGARDASLIAADKINAAGGINGHPVKLIIYDDETNPSKAVMALKKLIDEDKVLGFVGPIPTGSALACAPIAEEGKVPMFAGNSSSWSIAEKPWNNVAKPPPNIRRWVFKPGIDAIFQDTAVYRMFKDIGNIKKLAHINVNNAMGKAMRAAVEASSKAAGFEVVIWEEYGPDDTDMTAQLTKIKGVEFDAMIISGAEAAAGITYKQAREMGIKKPIIGMPPIVMGKIIDAVGGALDGLRVPAYVVELGETLPANDPQRPVVLELTNLLRKKTGQKKADASHAEGWDGVLVFADALKRANPDLTNLEKARSQVRDAMETIKGFVGNQAMGDMTKWHEIPAPMIPCEFKGGKLLIVGKKITPTWADLE